MILATDNLEEFHKQNLLQNKNHYTYMNRFTKLKFVNFFQQKGAKVHFNYMQIEDENSDQKEMIVTIYFNHFLAFKVWSYLVQ